MEKEANIRRYSAAELRARRTRGESRSDVARVRAKTEADLECDIASDPDFSDVPGNWYETAVAVMPAGKKLLSLRLDADVIEWFREQGPGYQTRINAVLRTFVEHSGKKGSKPRSAS